MNFSNFADQMLSFQHYEYIALPLFIILLVMFSLQQAGFIKSSEDKAMAVTDNRSFKLKFVDLVLIIMMLAGCAILAFKKNPGTINGQYLVTASIVLFFIKYIYDKVFKKEISVINQYHQNERLQNDIVYKNRKRNMIIYSIIVLFIITACVFLGDGMFSDPDSTVILIFAAIILYTVSFFIIWNKK